ncbi:unnamed protein product [Phyllotreta striolata]|uniref:Lipase domain-containing protein n=1 Tax=Phyllotreta striolata TaxID=444603 RepID=A0A9N9XNN9_PHYSR|nr:unnamed protein product [Phyllotreta striolata]
MNLPSVIFTTFIISLYSEILGVEVDEYALKFFFYGRKNQTRGIPSNISNRSNISKTSFSTRKDTFFIIHGWQDSVNSTSSVSIKEAILRNHKANVFLVYWDEVAKESYLKVVSKIEKLGTLLGTSINKFVNTSKLKLDTTTLVGHSLGAHIAGTAGAALNGKVGVIVGLDPAGVGYSSSTKSKLNASNAKFVHVIHTCGKGFGTMMPMGHADYYPNGGGLQPMCRLLNFNCSHNKALKYYVESLGRGVFRARKCDSYDDFNKGKCDNSTSSLMGNYKIDKKANGTYYLKTNLKPPYALNVKAH